MQLTAVKVLTLSEVFGTEMLGGLPPLVEELDDRLVQWRAESVAQVGHQLFRPGRAHHHAVAVLAGQARVMVEPSVGGFRN
jgi:hypothetical protein